MNGEKMQKEKILVTRSSMPPYEEYIEAIKPLWDSHWLTNMGRYHRELEGRLKEYLDVPQLSLMVNGHMALEMAIQMFRFSEGTEVITTPFTFVSTTHAIVRNNLKPVFCDVKLEDGVIDEDKIESLVTERTVAVVPVHVYGNACNIERIQKVADKYGLKVIYDAAHAFGVKYKGRGIGSFGDASVFSFHATKIYNTVEGGAVAFSDPKIYDRLYNLKNFGIRDEELITEVGANAKMNEFSAIMGLCNLNHAEKAREERRKRHELYREALGDIKGLRLFAKNPDATDNYAYFPILVEDGYPMARDDLYNFLRKNGVYARKYFYPLTADAACFKNKYKRERLERARELAERVLVIPFHAELGHEEMERVISLLGEKGEG